MKKILIIFLTCLLLVSMVGCSDTRASNEERQAADIIVTGMVGLSVDELNQLVSNGYLRYSKGTNYIKFTIVKSFNYTVLYQGKNYVVNAKNGNMTITYNSANQYECDIDIVALISGSQYVVVATYDSKTAKIISGTVNGHTL